MEPELSPFNDTFTLSPRSSSSPITPPQQTMADGALVAAQSEIPFDMGSLGLFMDNFGQDPLSQPNLCAEPTSFDTEQVMFRQDMFTSAPQEPDWLHCPLPTPPPAMGMRAFTDMFGNIEPAPMNSYEMSQSFSGPSTFPTNVPVYSHQPTIHPIFYPHPASARGPHMNTIHHTDDAAPKETPYLRRRCFNCHATQPPSWRRSTLAPGKIVCNKCGLYERTHMRPRPHRMDELTRRKSRKSSKVIAGADADKAEKSDKSDKSEESDSEPSRSGSPASINSGCSDFDDSLSICSSNGSEGVGSAFSSPMMSSFNIPTTSSPLQSPSLGAHGIRIPNPPMQDIAALPSFPGYPVMTRAERSYSSPNIGVMPLPMGPHRSWSMETGWQKIPMPALSRRPSKSAKSEDGEKAEKA